MTSHREDRRVEVIDIIDGDLRHVVGWQLWVNSKEKEKKRVLAFLCVQFPAFGFLPLLLPQLNSPV